MSKISTCFLYRISSVTPAIEDTATSSSTHTNGSDVESSQIHWNEITIAAVLTSLITGLVFLVMFKVRQITSCVNCFVHWSRFNLSFYLVFEKQNCIFRFCLLSCLSYLTVKDLVVSKPNCFFRLVKSSVSPECSFLKLSVRKKAANTQFSIWFDLSGNRIWD